MTPSLSLDQMRSPTTSPPRRGSSTAAETDVSPSTQVGPRPPRPCPSQATFRASGSGLLLVGVDANASSCRERFEDRLEQRPATTTCAAYERSAMG
jgi:hypothetical protein